jgi:hypothetical protein
MLSKILTLSEKLIAIKTDSNNKSALNQAPNLSYSQLINYLIFYFFPHLKTTIKPYP